MLYLVVICISHKEHSRSHSNW